MERPIYDCIAYDLDNELEDLRAYKKDLEKYTDFLENERSKQLALCEVMQPLIELSLNDIVVYNDIKPAMIIEELKHNFVNIKNEKGEIIKVFKGDLVKAEINVA